MLHSVKKFSIGDCIYCFYMRDSLKISYKHQDEKGNIAGFFQFWEEAILETINTSIKILVEDTFQRGGNHKEIL